MATVSATFDLPVTPGYRIADATDIRAEGDVAPTPNGGYRLEEVRVCIDKIGQTEWAWFTLPADSWLMPFATAALERAIDFDPDSIDREIDARERAVFEASRREVA